MRKPELYGFEGYEMFYLSGNLLDVTMSLHTAGYYWYKARNHFNAYLACGSFRDKNFTSHRELTGTAESVYIHPTCTLPRSVLRQQYKFKNNPWEADIVAVPKNTHCGEYTSLIFLNEEAGKIFVVSCPPSEKTDYSALDNELFSIVMQPEMSFLRKSFEYAESLRTMSFLFEELIGSRLIYAGRVSEFGIKQEAMYELMTGQIPAGKAVYEGDVFSGLDSAGREIDVETALSLQGMLVSKDDEIVMTGLKTLAMLDYTKCPNAAKYLMECAYRFNKAFSHTAVKFMVYLLDFKKNSNSNFREDFIEKNDAVILDALRKNDNDIFRKSRHWFTFIYMDENNCEKYRVRI